MTYNFWKGQGDTLLDLHFYVALMPFSYLTANVSHSTPLPYIQIIDPFLNLGISANHDESEGFQQTCEILLKEIFLYCKISFVGVT